MQKLIKSQVYIFEAIWDFH